MANRTPGCESCVCISGPVSCKSHWTAVLQAPHQTSVRGGWEEWGGALPVREPTGSWGVGGGEPTWAEAHPCAESMGVSIRGQLMPWVSAPTSTGPPRPFSVSTPDVFHKAGHGVTMKRENDCQVLRKGLADDKSRLPADPPIIHCTDFISGCRPQDPGPQTWASFSQHGLAGAVGRGIWQSGVVIRGGAGPGRGPDRHSGAARRPGSRRRGPAHPWRSAATWWHSAYVHPLGLTCRRCRCGACSWKADTTLRLGRWRSVGGLSCPALVLTSTLLPAVRNHLCFPWRARKAYSYTSHTPRFAVGETDAGEAEVELPVGSFLYSHLDPLRAWGKPRTKVWSANGACVLVGKAGTQETKGNNL